MGSQPPRRPSAAARHFVVFVIGLFAGVMCSVMPLRALQTRRGPFPSATTQLRAHPTPALRNTAAANRCTTSDVLPRLQTLRAVANDLEAAFPGLGDDARFAGAASGLRATLDGALAQPPSDCAQITATLEKIGDDCRA